MIEPASTLDMDDDTRGRMITRCVAYMTQRKIPIRDTRAVTRLLASNAGRIDGATNVKVRSYRAAGPPAAGRPDGYAWSRAWDDGGVPSRDARHPPPPTG